MPCCRTRAGGTNPKRLPFTSLPLRVKLVTLEEDAELLGLLERYDQLLCDWESLSHRALKALAGRTPCQQERHDALRRP